MGQSSQDVVSDHTLPSFLSCLHLRANREETNVPLTNCKGCPALQSAHRQQPPSGAHLRSSLCPTASLPALAAPARLRVNSQLFLGQVSSFIPQTDGVARERGRPQMGRGFTRYGSWALCPLPQPREPRQWFFTLMCWSQAATGEMVGGFQYVSVLVPGCGEPTWGAGLS